MQLRGLSCDHLWCWFKVICFFWHWPGLGLLSQACPWDSSTVTAVYLNVSHCKAMPLKLPKQFNKTDPDGQLWKLLVRMPPVMMVKYLWRRLKSPWSQFSNYENGVSKDKVALLIYCPEMFIKIHPWWGRFQTRKPYRKETEPWRETCYVLVKIAIYIHIYSKINIWRALCPKLKSVAAYRNEIVCLSKPLRCNFSLYHVSTTNPFTDVQLLPIQSMD